MIYQNQENMFGRNANGKRKFLLEAEVQKQQFPKIRKKKEIRERIHLVPTLLLVC